MLPCFTTKSPESTEKWKVEILISKCFFRKEFQRKNRTLVLTLTYKVVYATIIKSLSPKL